MLFARSDRTECCCWFRLGAASKESYHEDTYPNILHRYLKFDDEMSVVAVVWRDCEQLIEAYNDEQVRASALLSSCVQVIVTYLWYHCSRGRCDLIRSYAAATTCSPSSASCSRKR